MIEIRIHGRGGQGAVVASKLLADAVFREGRYVQVFPEFGVERRGAPVAAFARIDSKPINLRCKIYEPDHIIVLDPTLLASVDIAAGLKEGGLILINSDRPPRDFDLSSEFRVATIDATSIAVKYHLGSRATPIVNTAIVGAFAKVSGMMSIDSVIEAVNDEVPVKAEENVAAAREAYSTAESPKRTVKHERKLVVKRRVRKTPKKTAKRSQKSKKSQGA